MLDLADVRLTNALRAEGLEYAQLTRLAARGGLIRVRRGAYATTAAADSFQQHRRLLAATMPRLAPGAVVSHFSAALLHGLPTWPDELDVVHVTRPGSNGGRRGRLTHAHVTTLTDAEVTTLSGWPVTNLVRTVADVARTSSFERSVAVGDAALLAGLTKADLAAHLAASGRRVGDPQARRVCDFLALGAESVGESRSRILLARMGLPVPALQYEVFDPSTGELVGRADFAWEEFRTLGEFDGRIKYLESPGAGRSRSDVLFAEKLREDRLRDLGWEVVRWVWDDLRRPDVVAARLRRAFARSARRG